MGEGARRIDVAAASAPGPAAVLLAPGLVGDGRVEAQGVRLAGHLEPGTGRLLTSQGRDTDDWGLVERGPGMGQDWATREDDGGSRAPW